MREQDCIASIWSTPVERNEVLQIYQVCFVYMKQQYTWQTCKLFYFALKFGCRKLQDSPSPCLNTATLPDQRDRQSVSPHSPRQKCRLVQVGGKPIWLQSATAMVGSKIDNIVHGHLVRSWLGRSPVCCFRFKDRNEIKSAMKLAWFEQPDLKYYTTLK